VCEPTTLAVASTGLQMAGQLQQHSAADAARKGRNRAKLANFEEANRQYKGDQVYQAMVNQWTEQDQQLDELFAKGDQKIEQAIIEMYESDYAGTQTGRTAGRLAGKSAKKLGMMKSRELHSMMMAEDTVQLRKEAIHDRSQAESWKLYENIRFAPIHGHTPMAPSLEAAPSKAGLILGLASTAVGGISDFKDAQAPKLGSGKPDQSAGGASDPAPTIGNATNIAAGVEYALGQGPPSNIDVNKNYFGGSAIDSSAAWGITLQ
jgi:hypothetical protein